MELVTITNPELQAAYTQDAKEHATAQVPESAVPYWETRGWQTIPATPKTTKPAATKA